MKRKQLIDPGLEFVFELQDDFEFGRGFSAVEPWNTNTSPDHRRRRRWRRVQRQEPAGRRGRSVKYDDHLLVDAR